MSKHLREGGTLVSPRELLADQGFMTEVAVRGNGPGHWILLEPLVYEGKWDLFTVPAGFHTDFASVPRVLRSIVSETGVHTRAAVLHDYLLHTDITAADADGIFRRVLREAGVGFILRNLMWAAVRFGSGMEDASRKEWLQMAIITALAFIAVLMALTVVIAGVLTIEPWYG